ncbi:putative membrane protein C19orf24 [Collichthys lucidus]|uniref:Putative membrane protein C19orf24 n=1 Tax=Collichthys lucidus TaxID=240159 RepID=A0A4U5TWP4_COLLU|nr:putative membrane protein C19orf24 [Collichthys lucidus]
MTFYRVLSPVLVPICWLIVSLAGEDVSRPASPAAITPAQTNTSAGNSTHSGGKSSTGPFGGLSVDSSMIQRALYVLIGITMIGVLYFLIRAVRLKRPAQKKKYGLLSNYEDSVEMEAVESDEDDTLYEARSLRRSEVNTAR